MIDHSPNKRFVIDHSPNKRFMVDHSPSKRFTIDQLYKQINMYIILITQQVNANFIQT